MKTIISGLESSGKSLKLAMIITELVERNSKWYTKSGNKRPICSNLKFSETFTKYAESKNVPIRYWENLDDLIEYSNCDVLIDEVGNYFDARMWTDLSLDTRRWLTQGAKCGIEIYATAQDFAQIDKGFRRLTNNLYYIRKVIGSRRPSPTKPPVKFIWGVCMMSELNPQKYNEQDNKFEGTGLPSFFFIERKYCEIFDTTQKIERSKPPKLKHIAKECVDDSCSFTRVSHI